MVLVNQYVDAVDTLHGDVDLMATVVNRLDNAGDAADTILGLPENIAHYLRGRVAAVDLPNALVSVLGRLPYGIGFAIQQLNSVSNTVGFTLEQQVRTFEALDDAWTIPQAVVASFSHIMDGFDLTMNAVTLAMSDRVSEAGHLAAAMQDAAVPNDTELGARMLAFEADLQPWLAQRAALLATVAALEQAIDRVEALMPDLGDVQSIVNRALEIFTDAAAIARDIYDALNITISVWPFPSFNLIEAMATLSDWIGAIQSLIEDTVLAILSELGVDLNIFGGVEEAILEIMEPLFATFVALQAAAQGYVDEIGALLRDLGDDMALLMETLQTAVGINGLFANEVAVDTDTGGTAQGSLGEDGIFGGAGADDLSGLAGDDFIFGGAGNDRMVGQFGNDEMFGGDGNDSLVPGDGDDFVMGGAGTDTAILGVSLDDATIVDAGAWLHILSRDGQDTFGQVEHFLLDGVAYTQPQLRRLADARVVTGTEGADSLTGLHGDDTFYGLGGNDRMEGGAGGDHYSGGAGRDLVSYLSATRSVRVDLQNPRFLYGDAVGDSFDSIEVFVTGNTVDQLRGDAAGNVFYAGGLSDRLYGRAGNDALFGQTGADAFYGGLGADTMTGGADAGRQDRYIYFNIAESGVGAGNRDVITDFVSGEDRIEVRRFDADTTLGGKQGFDFVGEAGLSGVAGELAYAFQGGNTIIQADVDGDGLADFEVELSGRLALSAEDFLI